MLLLANKLVCKPKRSAEICFCWQTLHQATNRTAATFPTKHKLGHHFQTHRTLHCSDNRTGLRGGLHERMNVNTSCRHWKTFTMSKIVFHTNIDVTIIQKISQCWCGCGWRLEWRPEMPEWFSFQWEGWRPGNWQIREKCARSKC